MSDHDGEHPFNASVVAENLSGDNNGTLSWRVPPIDPPPPLVTSVANEAATAAAAATRHASPPDNTFNPDSGDTLTRNSGPRLSSGVPIDSKNTLQSHSVVVATALEPSQHDDHGEQSRGNQAFYKHIHGLSLLDAAADRAAPRPEEHVDSLSPPPAAQEAIPTIVHRATRTPISQLTVSAAEQAPYEPRPPTPMVVFASARFVDDETTLDAQAINALPVQAIHRASTVPYHATDTMISRYRVRMVIAAVFGTCAFVLLIVAASLPCFLPVPTMTRFDNHYGYGHEQCASVFYPNDWVGRKDDPGKQIGNEDDSMKTAGRVFLSLALVMGLVSIGLL
jgi:hypothetical protein